MVLVKKKRGNVRIIVYDLETGKSKTATFHKKKLGDGVDKIMKHIEKCFC